MRQINTLFLSALIALGLILPGAIVTSPQAIGAVAAQISPLDAHAGPIDGLLLEGGRAQRKADPRHDRRQDSGHERKQSKGKADHKKDHKKDRKQNHKQNRKQNRTKGGAADLQKYCTDPGAVQLRAVDGCTHGPDPTPRGLDIAQPVAPLTAGAVTAQNTAIACDGDGVSGYRVQALYVHASDVPSRYDQYVASIRAWAADADQIFSASSEESTDTRSLRFVHDATCQPTVAEVVVSPDGDGDFWKSVDELMNQGFNRTDRIYLAFVDASYYCGVGMLWSDDRADGNVNRNNIGPGFSRVDSGCWGGTVAAHELMHNLGGVQLSAPNASGGFHCIDEFDVMCYSDAGSGLPEMRVDCADRALDATRFDCGHDDYYNTNPAPGSYLANYWNPANSRFLVNAVPLAPPPAATTSPPTENDIKTKKTKKTKKNSHNKGKKHNNGKGKGNNGTREHSRS